MDRNYFSALASKIVGTSVHEYLRQTLYKKVKGEVNDDLESSWILLLNCPLAYGQDEEADAKVCVYSRNIDGFDALTDEHVFISARRNENYLFTMRRRCTGLRSAKGIVIKGTTSRVCADDFGEFVYRNMGRRVESCRIDNIERVESKDAAEELIKQREEENE